MVLCLIALPVLAILGIFSATHRKLATEAFDCVFRKVTLRKCQTNLDTKLKSSITATVMTRSPSAAGWVFKHFELLSWIFLILMVGSTFYSAYGIYNYFAYGNCNGENSSEYCALKSIEGGITGQAEKGCGTEQCNGEPCNCSEPCDTGTCPSSCKQTEGD